MHRDGAVLKGVTRLSQAPELMHGQNSQGKQSTTMQKDYTVRPPHPPPPSPLPKAPKGSSPFEFFAAGKWLGLMHVTCSLSVVGIM